MNPADPRLGGPRSSTPAAAPAPKIEAEEDKKDPGVAIAKKGVIYKPAKSAEEIEEEEFEKKLLAMEQEMKAEKSTPTSVAAGRDEMRLISPN